MTTSATSPSLLDRLASPTSQRRLALANLAAQIGITVTGVLVRVTASGLGCESWPQCHEGSYTPVQGAAPALHQSIEFGNRLLTFVLTAIAALLVLSVWRARRRAPIQPLAWATVGLIVLQAVIGGVTVLTGLTWWWVALHLLPSMLLIWIAGLILVYVRTDDDAPLRRALPRTLRGLAALATVALVGVLATGTMVTGAGPHAGDDRVSAGDRLEWDITNLAHVHGEFLIAFLALLVGLYLGARTVRVGRPVLVKIAVTAGMVLVQALVGFVQYRLAVPAWLVPVHMLLASSIVAHMAILYASTYARTPADVGDVAFVDDAPAPTRA